MHPIISLLVSLLLATLLVTGCHTNSPDLPQHIDLFDRHTVHRTTVNGHTIAYLNEGQGPPVILIHGFGGSMWQWEHQHDALAKHYRVITLDMVGSGLSDKPEIEYSPTFVLNSFLGFMDEVGIQQATLIGNSLGAGVAIGMALTYPDRVDKLVLISGFPAQILESIQSPSYKRFIDFRPPAWLARVSLWLAGRWTTERILKEIIYDPQHITPLLIERSYRNRQKQGFFHPLYSQIDHIQEWEEDFAPRLGHITHPTLVIWGDHDRIFPLSVGRTLHQTIPHSRFVEVPNSGHIPQWENPPLVNSALLQFLQESS